MLIQRFCLQIQFMLFSHSYQQMQRTGQLESHSEQRIPIYADADRMLSEYPRPVKYNGFALLTPLFVYARFSFRPDLQV